ncbi:MAG: hypothetical protein DRI61_10685 [Chloroflexi bacterium]|nr:MAG: hypothetical protein DRI61_10685 [Chloroflexota bacterium]HDN79312.1 DUF4013 domain-containing protein [Chloroflexota bacterium]
MDIGKAFTYVFEDENWLVKILIGGVLMLIPIANLISIGYALQVFRNVAEGQERPLPEWDDWGGYFMKGLMFAIGVLIYALPIIVLFIAVTALGAMTGAKQGEGALSNIASFCILCSLFLAGLYSLALAIWTPGVMIFYALSGEFGAMFRFGEIFNFISTNIGNYLIALVLWFVANFIASFGVILCAVGVAFTSFWAYLVGAHLYGQVWRLSPKQSTVV